MTVKTRLLRLALLVGCAAVVARAAVAQEITIWHDKGDDGIRMIQQMADKYKTDHPGVTVKSVSMPTDQWFSRSIAALNTGTSPDILFNDNARIVTIQQSTGKLTDLTQQFQQIAAKAMAEPVPPETLAAAQRATEMASGFAKSTMEKVMAQAGGFGAASAAKSAAQSAAAAEPEPARKAATKAGQPKTAASKTAAAKKAVPKQPAAKKTAAKTSATSRKP